MDKKGYILIAYVILGAIITGCSPDNFQLIKMPSTNQSEKHMHGALTTPHNHMHRHSGDHVHTHRCQYGDKTYPSSGDCGHMHGPNSKPHSHVSKDPRHGTGFPCQYKGYTVTSDINCGIYYDVHAHGLTINNQYPHGKVITHAHLHKHEGEHDHEGENKNICKTKYSSVPSNLACDRAVIDHEHAHRHGNEAIHSHKHIHQGDHAHDDNLSCVGIGDDHRRYSGVASCNEHKHEVLVEFNTKDMTYKTKIYVHKHDENYRIHKYGCFLNGKQYRADVRCHFRGNDKARQLTN